MNKETSLGVVTIKFANPKYNYTTNVSSSTTEAEAKKFFVGKMFNVGSYPKENMQEVIDIEFSKSSDKMKTGGGVGEFERLSNSTKSNELYITYNNFKSMYDSLMNGDDFDGKRFQGIINELTNIKNKAKKFKSANEIKGTEYMENGGSTKGFNYSIGGL